MKKFYTKAASLLASVLMISASATAGEVYLVGNQGGWDPSVSEGTLTETEDGSDIYTGEVEFSASWFCVATALSESSSDWDTFNAARYGGEYSNYPVTINEEASLVSRESLGYDNSYYIAESDYGTYTVTVDFNEMTILLYSEDYETEIPTEAYFLGNDGVWDPSVAAGELTETEETGVFEGTLTAEDVSDGYAYFCVVSALGEDSSDWTTINSNRYSPAQSGTELVDGEEAEMAHNVDSSWMIAAGEYTVTVDFNEMTILAVSTTSEEESEDEETGISTVEVDEESDGVVYDLSGRKLGTETPNEGIYIKDGKKYIAK